MSNNIEDRVGDNIVEEILGLLETAIKNIDGGCGYCIEAFVETANKSLAKFGYKYTYDVDDEGNDQIYLKKLDDLSD